MVHPGSRRRLRPHLHLRPRRLSLEATRRAPTRSLEARVADLHALLHAADIPGPYILVAHSFGGALVRLFTQTYPSEVAGLVLIDTTEEATIFRPSFTAYTAKLALFARAASLAARVGLVRQATTLFMRKTPPGFTPDSYGALKAFIAKSGFFRAMRDDATCLTRVPAAMRRIGGFGGTLGDRPLVVITHTEPFPGPAAVLEPGWAEGQARLASLSTRGSLLRAEGCNHMIPAEAPGLVVEAIRTRPEPMPRNSAHPRRRFIAERSRRRRAAPPPDETSC